MCFGLIGDKISWSDKEQPVQKYNPWVWNSKKHKRTLPKQKYGFFYFSLGNVWSKDIDCTKIWFKMNIKHPIKLNWNMNDFLIYSRPLLHFFLHSIRIRWWINFFAHLLICSWHQKTGFTNYRIYQFTNLKCCIKARVSFKTPFQWFIISYLYLKKHFKLCFFILKRL